MKKKVLLGALVVPALAACSAVGAAPPAPTVSGTAGATARTVTLVTHDSFALTKGILDDFTKQTGYTVDVVQPGDAGTLVNQLVLTKDAPVGDVTFGIDNTFASRALDAGVLVPPSPAPTGPAVQDGASYRVPGDSAGALTPVDVGDVCVNVDHAWFTAHHVAEPASLDDLTKPAYKNLFVTESPTTSSPGFAFLLATIGRYGTDGWQGYWKALKGNGVKVDDGWENAWNVDYTAGGGNGQYPIVLSYSSSPVDTIPQGASAPTTGALLDTCFRQVEYAGVIAGAKNPAGAAAFVSFLLSDEVQRDIPGSMYMYPVSSSVTVPGDWAQWAPLAPKPLSVPAADIAAHRSDWLQQWSGVVLG
jgi:thiamine transport system substrate-binding protein